MSVNDPIKPKPPKPVRGAYSRGATNHLAFLAVGILGVTVFASLGAGVHLTALTKTLNADNMALATVYQSQVDRVLGLANTCVVAIAALLAATRGQQQANDRPPDPQDDGKGT